MKENYKMIIAYDGTRYLGWEHQPNTDMTIQGKLEAVLSRMTETPCEVIGAGRTDAGVHARGMTANVWLDTALSEEEIRDYLNRYLPDRVERARSALNQARHQIEALMRGVDIQFYSNPTNYRE